MFNGLVAAVMIPLPVVGWNLKTFLTNSQNYVKTIGGLVIALLGAVLIIWAVWLIFRTITGQPGTECAGGLSPALVGLVFGGTMLFGAWEIFSIVANGGQTTINVLGAGKFLLPAMHMFGA